MMISFLEIEDDLRAHSSQGGSRTDFDLRL